MERKEEIKPIFNYIGGKSWLKKSLIDGLYFIRISRNISMIDTYIEPFCGGLGAFLGVHKALLELGIKKVILNDINSHLIDFYNSVVYHKEKLLTLYMEIEEKFKVSFPESTKLLHKIKDKEKIKSDLVEANKYFKKIKSKFNAYNNQEISEEDKIIKSSYLLFLQNHCFNGVYRENNRGEYNTPFNWSVKTYKKEVIEKKLNNFLSVLNLFEKVEFINKSFEDLDFTNNQIIYCDPPYLNEKDVENKYNKNGFSLETQLLLISKIAPFNFIYSNHKNSLLIEAFNNKTHVIVKEAMRKNIISSKKESRSEDKVEIIVIKHLNKNS